MIIPKPVIETVQKLDEFFSLVISKVLILTKRTPNTTTRKMALKIHSSFIL